MELTDQINWTAEQCTKNLKAFTPEHWMCCAFSKPDAAAAWNNLSAEYILEYGSECNGRPLHTWDKGERTLAR